MADFIEKIPSEKADEEAGVTIYNIANYPADYTLQGLYDKYKNQEIIIPSFQRKFVWSLSQSSKLIESFLLGLPVPGLFLYKDKETQKLKVIDGQQRLKTIFGYFDGTFPDSKKNFRLKGVNKKWEDKSFSDLDDPDKRRLKDSVLRAIIVEQLDPKDNTSIFHIFYRLNTGSTILTPQEIRNSIYQGKFNDLLVNLNNNKEWRKIIGLPSLHKRMRDIELIIRFLSLYDKYKEYKPPMRDFLSNFMATYRNDEINIKKFEKIFNETVGFIEQHIGPRPFVIKAGLQAAVFDSIMVAFALNLDKIPSDIKERHQKLLRDQEYIDCVYSFTTSKEHVQKRINIAIRKLFG